MAMFQFLKKGHNSETPMSGLNKVYGEHFIGMT